MLMTGTALENHTKEMLFLLQILRPKIASMAMGFAKESTSQEFMQMIAPIYYRRKREDVLKELPELIEEESWIEGGEAEMAAYEEAAVKEEFMTMRRVSFNVDDFEGTLDGCRLRFELDYSSSYLACFVPNYLSIVFSRHFEFDYRKYRNTMVHEMCHYYLYSFSGENGYSNTFKYETVHGKAFQDLVDRLNSKHAELNVMLRDCDC